MKIQHACKRCGMHNNIFVSKDEGNIPFWRSRRRRKDDIKTGPKKYDVV
jgi:hypothetical protein